MSKFRKESSFFTDEKKQKGKSCKRMVSLLNRIGGRKGMFLASVLLDKPKYKDLP